MTRRRGPTAGNSGIVNRLVMVETMPTDDTTHGKCSEKRKTKARALMFKESWSKRLFSNPSSHPFSSVHRAQFQPHQLPEGVAPMSKVHGSLQALCSTDPIHGEPVNKGKSYRTQSQNTRGYLPVPSTLRPWAMSNHVIRS